MTLLGLTRLTKNISVTWKKLQLLHWSNAFWEEVRHKEKGHKINTILCPLTFPISDQLGFWKEDEKMRTM